MCAPLDPFSGCSPAVGFEQDGVYSSSGSCSKSGFLRDVQVVSLETSTAGKRHRMMWDVLR